MGRLFSKKKNARRGRKKRTGLCDGASLEDGSRIAYSASSRSNLEGPASHPFVPYALLPPEDANPRLMTNTVTPESTALTKSGTSKERVGSARKRHIISILLQNEVGALTRVTGLFSTRGYNIESLNVAPTEDTTVSRLTLVTTGTDTVVQQIVNQSLKLIDVVNVDDMTRDQHVERELLLLKLRVSNSQRGAVNSAVQGAGGKVLADDVDGYIVELTDREAQINRFVAEAAQYGEILEVVRSGTLAMVRGATALRP